MPSDRKLKTMNTLHRLLLGVTRGRKGWFVANMPVL
ncbi:MAG: nitroreductase family deazaflavin-dependent oxidoreductase, partial [Actinomycetota bacterium]|nr:nitroreductase family deazaflavin-dependent oxidoreductase [Actinomycetota bacterium]